MTPKTDTARLTQAERRTRTRNALLEAAARGLSEYGYGALALERVAAEAGYTRGALYHQFANKEELALAVVAWVDETWSAEVEEPAMRLSDPAEILLAVARGHAIYCRRNVARVLMTLRIEFAGREHPVGAAIMDLAGEFLDNCARWIAEGRATGSIPPGPPPEVTATAYLGALEGLMVLIAGKEPYDVELAERMVRGILGLASAGLRRHQAG